MGCVGSAPVTSFRVTVQPTGNSPATLIRQVNNLAAGSRIAYRPLDLPADMKKDAKLTLVLVPDNPDGNVTPELPRPAAGEGSKQTLRIAMPWPSPTPKAPLYVWLRGESEGRATRVNP
jgi:hypothetical protein